MKFGFSPKLFGEDFCKILFFPISVLSLNNLTKHIIIVKKNIPIQEKLILHLTFNPELQ